MILPFGVVLFDFIEKEIRHKRDQSHKYWLTQIGHFEVSYQGKYHPFTIGGERVFEDDYHGYEKVAEGIYQHKDISYMYVIDGDEYSITFE